MFSEQQRDYIRQLVLSQKEYKYYVAVTRTNVAAQGGNNANDVNFTVYLSNKPITGNSLYSYTFTGDVVSCSVRGSNGNYNYHAQRVQWQTGVSTLTIESYEFVYTNASFSGYATQPDCLIPAGVQQSHFDGFASAILIVLISVILCKMMLKGGGGFGRL